MVELRDYQKEIVQKGLRLLTLLKIIYLAMEVRVGKTLTALTIADEYGAKKVLFVTKKKAMSSIQKDYDLAQPGFTMDLINYESLHKITDNYDLIIADEAHSLGAFPKMSKCTKQLQGIVGNKPLILMSGTPSPESFSQLFHQFAVSLNTPFKNHGSFYKWAKEFVTVKQRMINGFIINDYSGANVELIKKFTDAYFISFTQKEAGFESEVVEEVKHVCMKDYIYKLADILIRDRYYKLKSGGEIVCDTAAKLKSKLHQIYSGTIKCEDGSRQILDSSKAEYIRNNYQGEKLAIFYKFVAEGDLLKCLFPNWTDSPDLFSLFDDKTFICQIQSGSMGTNLSTTDYIIFYNIDFSALLYFQARSRTQTKDKTEAAKVHWIFSQNGIEDKIYRRVIKKKDFTTEHFRKEYLCQNRLFKESA